LRRLTLTATVEEEQSYKVGGLRRVEIQGVKELRGRVARQGRLTYIVRATSTDRYEQTATATARTTLLPTRARQRAPQPRSPLSGRSERALRSALRVKYGDIMRISGVSADCRQRGGVFICSWSVRGYVYDKPDRPNCDYQGTATVRGGVVVAIYPRDRGCY
jgi:hypothetical protein